MHRQGTPATMQRDPHYDDVVAEVTAFLDPGGRGGRGPRHRRGVGRPGDRVRQDHRPQPEPAAPPRRDRRPRLPGGRRDQPQGLPRRPRRALRRRATSPRRSTTGSRPRWPPRPGPWPTAPAWSGCTTSSQPSKQRKSWQHESRGNEGQMGAGDQAPQLPLGDQGPARALRAAGRLRRQPPPRPPPGGDHLDPRTGVRVRDLADPRAAQPAQLRRSRGRSGATVRSRATTTRRPTSARCTPRSRS